MSHAVTFLKALEKAPHGFSFFEAIRRLECLYLDKPRMGQSQRVADDPHRMLSLFYRAWASAQPTVSFDRPASDRFGVYVASLFGLGMPSLRHCDTMPDLAKLHYAGQLVGQTRHAEGLRAILAGFFKLPVAIAEFIGEWLALPEPSRCRLGESRETGTPGVTAFVGGRVWGCQDKFRIILGPLGLADYRRLLPGGDSLPRLVAVVRNYIGEPLNWDVQLVLRKEEIRKEEITPCKLGEMGQLGWTAWLASAAFDEDADDLVLSPLTYVN